MPNPKLPRFIFALLLLVLFARLTVPQQATERVASGKLIEIRITAPSLKGNLLGDRACVPIVKAMTRKASAI
jgi:hypothetical protein